MRKLWKVSFNKEELLSPKTNSPSFAYNRKIDFFSSYYLVSLVVSVEKPQNCRKHKATNYVKRMLEPTDRNYSSSCKVDSF